MRGRITETAPVDNLRLALNSDIDLLYQWANDNLVRANAFHTEPIPYEDHKRWFNKALTDKSTLIFIYEMDGAPIGQVRLTIEDNTSSAEIDYSIAEDKRGRGFGKRMLHLLRQKIAAEYPEIEKLVARVKPENIASKRVFLDSGFSEKYELFELEMTAGIFKDLEELQRNVPFDWDDNIADFLIRYEDYRNCHD